MILKLFDRASGTDITLMGYRGERKRFSVMKMLLVNDEKVIQAGLVNLTVASTMGVEIIAVAKDSNQAASLAKEFHNVVLIKKDKTQSSGEMYSPEINKALKFIDDNLDNVSLSLQKVAHTVGMSPCYFSTVFKREKGEKFVNYIMKCRIQKAKDLLENTQLIAGEVCEMVGYTNYSYFSAFFKKYTGMSPSEFKKVRQNLRCTG